MKIQRYFDESLKKHFWKIDLTISGKRIRENGLATKAEAEEIITKLKAARRTRRHGLRKAAAVLENWCREIDGFIDHQGELRDAMLL